METVKEPLQFRHMAYDVEIAPLGEKRLRMTVTDRSLMCLYHEDDLNLEFIGSSTMINAFRKNRKELTVEFNPKKSQKKELLEIEVTVKSSFLKDVKENIFIKKTQDLNQVEMIQKSVTALMKRVKEEKLARQERDDPVNEGLQVWTDLPERRCDSSAQYEMFAKIDLKKGKYVIKFSFLAKTQGSMLYCYLNKNTIQMHPNCCLYSPTNSYFVPFEFTKVHTVAAESQEILLEALSTQSYPVTFRNVIVTAKRIG